MKHKCPTMGQNDLKFCNALIACNHSFDTIHIYEREREVVYTRYLCRASIVFNLMSVIPSFHLVVYWSFLFLSEFIRYSIQRKSSCPRGVKLDEYTLLYFALPPSTKGRGQCNLSNKKIRYRSVGILSRYIGFFVYY